MNRKVEVLDDGATTARRTMLIALVCLFSCAAVAQKLEAVPLLLKPKEETGRITLAAEGLEVLRNAPKVFGIIAAVGPTRTGKSTILGRAFLRGKHENAFEIGGGVTSFTLYKEEVCDGSV